MRLRPTRLITFSLNNELYLNFRRQGRSIVYSDPIPAWAKVYLAYPTFVLLFASFGFFYLFFLFPQLRFLKYWAAAATGCTSRLTAEGLTIRIVPTRVAFSGEFLNPGS